MHVGPKPPTFLRPPSAGGEPTMHSVTRPPQSQQSHSTQHGHPEAFFGLCFQHFIICCLLPHSLQERVNFLKAEFCLFCLLCWTRRVWHLELAQQAFGLRASREAPWEEFSDLLTKLGVHICSSIISGISLECFYVVHVSDPEAVYRVRKT